MSIDEAKEILYGPGSPQRVMPWDNIKLGIEASRVLLEDLKEHPRKVDAFTLIPVLDLMLTTMEGIAEQLKRGAP